MTRTYGNIPQIFVITRTKVVGIAGGLFLFGVISGLFVQLLLRLALRAVVAVIAGGRGFIEQFIRAVVGVVLFATGRAVPDPLADRVWRSVARLPRIVTS